MDRNDGAGPYGRKRALFEQHLTDLRIVEHADEQHVAVAGERRTWRGRL